MLLLSIISLQFGTALAGTLLAASGVIGIAFLRNAVSSVLLWGVTRPKVRRYTSTQWRYAALLGLVTAGMNVSFYAAAERIPMGIVVAIDFLGPITVALVRSRRRRHLPAPILALMGIALLTPIGGISPGQLAGMSFAVCAAMGWGLYIILTARTSQLFGEASGLTLATTFGTLALLPLLFFTDLGTLSDPSVLLLGAVVALLSTTVPFLLEFAVLRRMPERTFGILVSVEPAVAALIGLVVLHQSLDGMAWAAIVLIVCAGVVTATEVPDGISPAADQIAHSPDRTAADFLPPLCGPGQSGIAPAATCANAVESHTAMTKRGQR